MLTLVAAIDDRSCPTEKDEDDDDSGSCYSILDALFDPFIAPDDHSLDREMGFYLTPTETRFLVRQLVCVGSFVSKIRWRSFDTVQATGLVHRLAGMNALECLKLMNDLQADPANPRLTSRLSDFGEKYKCYYGGKSPRVFVAALFAALLTL